MTRHVGPATGLDTQWLNAWALSQPALRIRGQTRSYAGFFLTFQTRAVMQIVPNQPRLGRMEPYFAGVAAAADEEACTVATLLIIVPVAVTDELDTAISSIYTGTVGMIP